MFCPTTDFASFKALMFRVTSMFPKKANKKNVLASSTPPDLEHSVPNFVTDLCFTISKEFKMCGKNCFKEVLSIKC